MGAVYILMLSMYSPRGVVFVESRCDEGGRGRTRVDEGAGMDAVVEANSRWQSEKGD